VIEAHRIEQQYDYVFQQAQAFDFPPLILMTRFKEVIQHYPI